jgi:hypothetical protein
VLPPLVGAAWVLLVGALGAILNDLPPPKDLASAYSAVIPASNSVKVKNNIIIGTSVLQSVIIIHIHLNFLIDHL